MGNHSNDDNASGPDDTQEDLSDGADPDIPEGDMDFDHMVEVERRIRAGEPVTAEERETYEKISANIKDTLKTFRLPSTAFKVSSPATDIAESFRRSQQAYLSEIVKKLQQPFSIRPDVRAFNTTTAWGSIPAHGLHLTRVPAEEHIEGSEDDEDDAEKVRLDPGAIETEPVEQAIALMALNEHLEHQSALARHGNKIAEQQVEETRHLKAVMDLVRHQSDEQGRFSRCMALFMAAIGIGTIVIPVAQWIF